MWPASHKAKYKIPSSITLAQGLLESGAGKSDLAIKSNNHFGIKCHNTDWKGATVVPKDDKADDCFRKYDRVEDSMKTIRCLLRKAPLPETFRLADHRLQGMGYRPQTAGCTTDRKLMQQVKVIEDCNFCL